MNSKQVLVNETSSKIIPEALKGIQLIENNIKSIDDSIKVIYILTEGVKNSISKILNIGGKGGFMKFDESIIDDNNVVQTYIKHPYIDKNINVEYIDETDNEILTEAEEITKEAKILLSHNNFPSGIHVTSAIIATDEGRILGAKSNADYHVQNGCGRFNKGYSTGESYEECEGCQPQNHGEQKALDQALELGYSEQLKGAKGYLYGHYWITKHCIDSLLKAGISEIIIAKEFAREYLDIRDFKNIK